MTMRIIRIIILYKEGGRSKSFHSIFNFPDNLFINSKMEKVLEGTRRKNNIT